MPKSLFGYTNILLRNSDLDISARSLSISGSVLKINSPNKMQAVVMALYISGWPKNRDGTVGASQWVLEVPAQPLPNPLR